MSKGTLNKALLMGRLGKDPGIKYTSSGKAVANFSIATNEVWSKDGEKQEKTDWHNIVLWGKLAELAGEYLSKGSKVFIEGKIRTRTWDDEKGTHYMTEIIGDRLEFLDSKREAPEHAEKPGKEDLPF